MCLSLNHYIHVIKSRGSNVSGLEISNVSDVHQLEKNGLSYSLSLKSYTGVLFYPRKNMYDSDVGNCRVSWTVNHDINKSSRAL